MRFLGTRRALFLEITAAAAAVLAVALFSLFPGARLGGLCLTALAALLFGLSPDRPRRWLRTPLDWPALLLLLQVALSLAISIQPDKSRVAACQLLAGLVACYALLNWSRDRARLCWAAAALLVLGVALALIAPFAVDWFRNRKTFLPTSWYDFFPLLLPDSIHPNVMAGSLVTLAPLPLALALADVWSAKKWAWLRWLLVIAWLWQLVVLLLTKSRGGYVAAGLGLGLTLWLSGRRRWAVTLTLLGVALFVWLLAQPSTEMNGGLAPSGAAEASQAALDPSTWAFRRQVWWTALRLIGDFPFTGVGLGAFNDAAALLYGFYAPQTPQAHNLFLQVGVDLGVPGLIGFLAIFLLALNSARQACSLFADDPTLRALAVAGLAGLIATAAHGLIDVHTWGSKGAFIPWLLLGLVVALRTLAWEHWSGLNQQRTALVVMDAQAASRPRRRSWNFWLGLLLSLACLLWAIRALNWSDVFAALARANPWRLGLALLAVLLTIATRLARWSALIYPRQARWQSLLATMLVGQLLNYFAPARAGDLTRAYLLGYTERESKAWALGTIALEKLWDIWALLAMVVWLSFSTALPAWFVSPARVLALLSLLALLFSWLALARRARLFAWLAAVERYLPARLSLRFVGRLLDGLDGLRRPRVWLWAAVWSAATWLGGALTNHIVLLALGLSLPFAASLMLMVVLQLGVAAPTLPGRVGLYEGLCMVVLALFGVAQDAAFAAGLTLHVVSFMPPILLGLYFAWRMGGLAQIEA